MGSLSELETQLIIAKNLGYLAEGVLTPSLDLRIEEIRKPLIGLIHYLEEKVGAGK
jgi:four helix bundle protein